MHSFDMKKCNLHGICHVTLRASRLSKSIVHGTVSGRRRRGRNQNFVDSHKLHKTHRQCRKLPEVTVGAFNNPVKG